MRRVARWVDRQFRREVSWPTFIAIITGVVVAHLISLLTTAERSRALQQKMAAGVESLDEATHTVAAATRSVESAVHSMDTTSKRLQLLAIAVASLGVIVGLVAIFAH